jgi:hypothetical protein
MILFTLPAPRISGTVNFSCIFSIHFSEPYQSPLFLTGENRNQAMNANSFIEFDADKLEAFASLPQSTKEYYRSEVVRGSNPLRFAGVPHILHKGSIDVSDLPVITV